jgi:hypothetical protein
MNYKIKINDVKTPITNKIIKKYPTKLTKLPQIIKPTYALVDITKHFVIEETPWYTSYKPINAQLIQKEFTCYVDPNMQIIEVIRHQTTILIYYTYKTYNVKKHYRSIIDIFGVYITYPMDDTQVLRQYR